MRAILLALATVLAACGSSKQEETPKPPLVVDCHGQPPSTTTPQLKCSGLCVARDPCADGAAPACPAGYVGYSGECDNGAICCTPADAWADASADGPTDAAPEAEDAPAG
jgi:hypothetical protein